ncbi:MAG: hypothetical protein IRZ06_03455 [Nevskia sp.]|nr:hypothetical protein [Nevskia sp.]
MPSKLTNILAAARCCVATAAPGTALHEVVHGHELGAVVPPTMARRSPPPCGGWRPSRRGAKLAEAKRAFTQRNIWTRSRFWWRSRGGC